MLERFKIFEERIAGDRKAKTSSGATLNNASHNRIKEVAEAFGNINCIIEVEKGFKKVEEPWRETIMPKNHQNPLVAKARKSIQKIKESQDRLVVEMIVVSLGPSDSIKTNNVKNKLAPCNKSPLDGRGEVGDSLGKLGYVSACDSLVVGVFEA